MASKNNEKGTPSSPYERKPRRVQARSQRWENVRLDAFRIYILESNSLEVTMAAIQEIHGLQASPRRWKDKLNEWGYKKNMTTHDMQYIVAKRTKRAREGKDTDFSYGDTQITPNRIKNFKRRNPGEVLPDVPTPSNIKYNTPSLKSERSERTSPEETRPYPTNVSQGPSFSMAKSRSIGSIDSHMASGLTHQVADMPKLPRVPLISMLHRYMSGEVHPWSQYHLSHQLGDHSTVLDKLKQEFMELSEVLHLSNEQSSSPGLCCLENQFLLDFCCAKDEEQGEESCEAAILEELLGLAVGLADSHLQHGRFAPQTLLQEFKLTKAVERNGNHEESEYHCRKILGRCSQTDVESFLGMILANSSRLEESTCLLFRALTSFIINFGDYSLEANALLFAPVESLFTELLLRSEQNWAALTSCICKMMTTMRKAMSEGSTIIQIHPQLFIYGFSFARECLVLGFTDSAKCMYRYLLEHASAHLDATLHGIEKSAAHQTYGLLLRREEEWTSSAEQLLLACKSAMESGTYHRRLNVLLETNYVDLLPYLASEPNEEDSLTARIRGMLNRIQLQSSTHIRNSSEADQMSRIEDYFWSGLPRNLATHDLSAATYVGQLGLPSMVTGLSQTDGGPTSTESMSASLGNKYGLTYSVSEITGISDSIFMTP